MEKGSSALEDLVKGADAWRGRRVFITGHTGFKGSWLSLWLNHLGAEVTGYALLPPTVPSLFEAARVADIVRHVIGDIRDMPSLSAAMAEARPEVIFHLAAQPLVRLSYDQPLETYATNVMGTVHLLEAARRLGTVGAFVCVTTDKCYENREWIWPYRETDPMGGHDPYSSSKGCAELIVSAYRRSFFPLSKIPAGGMALATARAGNVIGGGDWAADRLVPDLVRAFSRGDSPILRSPGAIRPWQHVLDALAGYLRLAEGLLADDVACADAWNFGPTDDDARTVSWIVERMRSVWTGVPAPIRDTGIHPHEAQSLRLDSSKARAHLGWRPGLKLEDALDWIVSWHRSVSADGNAREETLGQIQLYMERMRATALAVR